MEFILRRAAYAVPPQDGSVVNKSEPQLRLQIKVLPSSRSHRGMENIGHMERYSQGHIRLDQIQHLQRDPTCCEGVNYLDHTLHVNVLEVRGGKNQKPLNKAHEHQPLI